MQFLCVAASLRQISTLFIQSLSPDRRRCDGRKYAMTPSDSFPDTDTKTPLNGKSNW